DIDECHEHPDTAIRISATTHRVPSDARVTLDSLGVVNRINARTSTSVRTRVWASATPLRPVVRIRSAVSSVSVKVDTTGMRTQPLHMHAWTPTPLPPFARVIDATICQETIDASAILDMK
ncbi:hypothetical protein PENTCL1PPCAC_27071, partial [Pristionchus entomophagus]